MWFNGRTEAFQASDAGSIPVTRSIESAQVRLMIRLTCLLYRHFGTWRSLVARLLWEQDVAGSNPVVPTISCGRSSMVEPQPSKLMTRVRFPSPAPEKQQVGHGKRSDLFSFDPLSHEISHEICSDLEQ